MCISLNLKVSELPTTTNELRRRLRKVEKLKDILFVERYKFFKLVKAKGNNCVDISIDQAFDMLSDFSKHLTKPSPEGTNQLEKANYEAVANLMSKSKAMNSSGFVMQVKLCTRAVDS